jgi:hypothetical protein
LWDSLSVNSVKKPRFYNPKTADPFSRLRVPKYLKIFEVLFFATFLALYYSVLVERNPERISPLEICLYIWLSAFAYDELSEWIDAGSIFYAADVWVSTPPFPSLESPLLPEMDITLTVSRTCLT